MMIDSEIIIVGSHAPGIFVQVKRVPKAGETVIGWNFDEPVDGGKGSNQAIAAARLGGRICFVGCVGQDRIGEEGKQWMQEAGVNTDFLRVHEQISSGVGFIMLSENGVPAMVTSMGANAAIEKADIDGALETAPGSKIIMTQFELPLDIAMYAIKKGREAGKMTIVNPGPAPEEPIPFMDAISVLIPNETEAQVLLAREPGEAYKAEELVRSLRTKTGIENVIITLGDEGVVGVDADGYWQLDALDVDVVDTSGAGDVFCAALAVSIVNGKSVREASSWANTVAGLSVTRPGTIPAFPTLDEVTTFLKVKLPA
jgi:ribokinase